MPGDQDTTQTDETLETPTEEISHDNGVADRIARLEQQQALNHVLSDPDVRAVIDAKRQGKKIKVAEDAGEAPAETPEPSVADDLPADDPMRETLSRIDKMLKTRIGAAVEPLSKRLEGVESLASEVQKKDVSSQVAAAKAKYKDLDQFKTEMVELSRDNPTLGVEDLYILAKHRSGKLRQAETATFTEKPTQHTTKPAPKNKQTTSTPRPQGRKGFSQILSGALNELDLSEAND